MSACSLLLYQVMRPFKRCVGCIVVFLVKDGEISW